MWIEAESCIGCERCVAYCPSDAISLADDGAAVIDDELCTECSTCLRVAGCPVDVFRRSEVESASREIRGFFSDPAATHSLTQVPGRGTEEVKTNDVTGRVTSGEVGIAVEMGRPCLGTTLKEVENVTKALASLKVHYEQRNPVAHLLESEETGQIKPEYLGERVTSLILEFTVDEKELENVVSVLLRTAQDLGTVFTLDVMSCFDANGSIPVMDKLSNLGLEPRPNAKVNLGLGRPLAVGKGDIS